MSGFEFGEAGLPAGQKRSFPRFGVCGHRAGSDRKKPWAAIVLLTVLVLGCMCCELIMTKDPVYMDLTNSMRAPDREFLFGTDTLGRDIFSMIWYGGRISLLIGCMSTLISTAVAVVFGAVNGLAPQWLDTALMRLTEIILSVPSLLVIVFVQAVLGEANVFTISFVIGITSWCSIAKVVRTEVRKLGCSEFIIASRCMGGGFFHILWRHLLPNFTASILFMVIMNIRSAIVAESTLSFLGLGLPLEVISWGSMLSLAQNALLGGAWWMVLIPGGFLVTTLLCITGIGNYMQGLLAHKERNM